VESALRSDPYFYDAHVTVSTENGNVVLQGFVSGPWDLLDAIRIARKAAGNTRVIDDLEILLGGGKKWQLGRRQRASIFRYGRDQGEGDDASS
jgi:BON domain